MIKNEIRDIVKAKKSKLQKKEIDYFSSIITNKLLSMEVFRRSSVIFIYIAYNQEVLTFDIINEAWKNGKKIAVPKIINSAMEFYYINSFNELSSGYFGIMEPDSFEPAVTDSALIIMPGLAFDKNMNRIGYGGGFYDKYFSNHNMNILGKIALAYDFQIFDHIETMPHDCPVDIIITPTKIIGSLK